MIEILTGDCREVLRTLPADSVHCAVTSPPYWGLRDYGVPPSVWGGDDDCDHQWGDDVTVRKGSTNGRALSTLVSAGSAKTVGVGAGNDVGETKHYRSDRTAFCHRCGAWAGAHGLEPNYSLYVENEVRIFAEVRRVLRPDGTLWLNLGDSYATGAGKVGDRPGGGAQGDAWGGHRGSRGGSEKQPRTGSAIGPMTQPNRMPQPGLKPKDLCGIPWRVAFALQADGWYLRQDIIWHKPNSMPESVADRCTKAHEYIFLFSKSPRYFYDADAIAEPASYSGLLNQDESGFKSPQSFNGKYKEGFRSGGRRKRDSTNESFVPGAASHGGIHREGSEREPATRNKRSVWTVPTAPYSEAHFATFPPALIEPCILAGCPERCCAACGAPWCAEIERVDGGFDGSKYGERAVAASGGAVTGGTAKSTLGSANGQQTGKRIVAGYLPSCECGAPAVPGVALDPFGGAGTTGLVADRNHRSAVLIELNPTYAEMARRRIHDDAPLFSEVAQ